MDHIIEAAMRRPKIRGLSLAVVREGRFVCARGFGLALAKWLPQNGFTCEDYDLHVARQAIGTRAAADRLK